MPTWDGVVVAFEALTVGGYKPPFTTEEEAETAIRTWIQTMPEASDELLMAAVRGHMRGSSWWPKPYDLVQLLPDQPGEDDGRTWRKSGRLWARLKDGDLRMQVLSEANASYRPPPPHGRDCPGDCEPCTEGTFALCDRYVQQMVDFRARQGRRPLAFFDEPGQSSD